MGVGSSLVVESVQSKCEGGWTLVERYVADYPHDWRMVFKQGDEVLEVSVPEEVWRAFDR